MLKTLGLKSVNFIRTMTIFSKVLLLLVFIYTSVTYADNSNLTDTEIYRKTDFIQKSMDNEKLYSQIWWYGWIAMSSGEVLYGLSAGLASKNVATRVTEQVSAVQSGLGLLGLILMPQRTAYSGSKMASLSTDTEQERMEKLSYGEKQLESTAQVERLGHSWLAHLVNTTVSLGGGIIVYGYKNAIIKDGGNPSKAAWETFLYSFIIGELQILTQPTGSMNAWDSYESSFKNSRQAHFNVIPTDRGLTFGVSWDI